MTAQVHREIEVKLEVDEQWTMPSLPASVGAVRAGARRTLTATYYDTDDLRLARHRITLRRRSGGNDDGWHLKLPGTDDHARDEVCLPLLTPGEPPLDLVWMVLGFTRAAVLSPVATLVNVRRPWRVIDGDGDDVAEITDDHVTVEREGQPVVRFREVEVEAAGTHGLSDLRPIVDALIASGARPSSFASKAVRALGPDATRPTDADAGPGVGGHATSSHITPAHTGAHQRVRQLVSQLQHDDLAVRRDLPHAVASYAKTVTHLHHALADGDAPYDGAWRAAIVRELGGVVEVLGRLHVAGGPEAAREIHDLLREPRYVALLDRLVEACQTPQVAAGTG